MNVNQVSQNGALVVEIAGRLDGGTSPELSSALSQILAERPPRLVLDLDALEYVSSAGLRVLMIAAKEARSLKIALSLCGLRSNVRELFEISGLTQVFVIHPERGSAVGAA